MKSKFPKELMIEIPVDEEKETQKIRDLFIEHQALNHTHTISYEILKKENINEFVFKKMINKSYVRYYKGQYYYNKNMENIQYRRHIRNLRITIYGSLLIYALVTAYFFYEFLKH